MSCSGGMIADARCFGDGHWLLFLLRHDDDDDDNDGGDVNDGLDDDTDDDVEDHTGDDVIAVNTGKHMTTMVMVLAQGTLGLGSGKGSELPAALRKANARALKNLFFVPRYDGATIYQSRKAKFGRAQVIMYPRSTGSGILASNMVTAICNLAGIKDIGVKVGRGLPCSPPCPPF